MCVCVCVCLCVSNYSFTLYPPHSDPMCQEAADIVTGDCPALAEKMYNCSRLFEEDIYYSDSYTRRNCEKVDLMKV